MEIRDLGRDCASKALSLALAAVLAVFVSSASISPAQDRFQPPPKNPPETQEGTVPAKPGQAWKEVDRLIDEQKFEAAIQLVEKIRLAARKKGDADEWTRALVKEVQLRTGLHGYETSVRFLKEQPWPDGGRHRAVLNLFYARCLVIYCHEYSWEISRREKVESKAAVDLKAWTRDQIFQEAGKAYLEVWKQRRLLGEDLVSRLAEYLDPNNFPEGIRGTLRDAVTYLFVELLADTSFWRPEESNELYRLDLKGLVRGGSSGLTDEQLADPALHPLVKVGYVLDDLESWHAAAGERGAALEARLVRLSKLHDSFTASYDREIILQDLEARLPGYRDVEWWAQGQATLAKFVQESDKPGKLEVAREIAEQGVAAYPGSVGGQRCAHIVASIEAPDYSLQAMSLDGARKRSLLIEHKNLKTLYFRAVPLDLEERIGRAKDYKLLPADHEMKTILAEKPVASWKVDLPPTPDYESHKTYVVPPLSEPGMYVVAASARQDFEEAGGNRIVAANVLVTGLVLLSVRASDDLMEVRVVSGETGQPAAGAKVGLYRFDWKKGHHLVLSVPSDAQGLARIPVSKEYQNGSCFLLARKGKDLALDSKYFLFFSRSESARVSATLLYTDRSIYRPNQKLYWKALVYRGKGQDARLTPQASALVTVTLYDPNGEKVDSRSVTTNAFGTASGEFTVPTGRLLGAWRLRSSPNGSASVRVEEYKRPTFEVTFKDPTTPLRLNKPAQLTGDVKYYFGLPVVNGTVKWRATRQPVYPWWWEWYGWGARQTQAQTVAAGTARLKEDGTFTAAFTPEADERLAAGGDVTYRYAVTADVIDEGGETRSATRSFRLGFTSVEAGFDTRTEFFEEGKPGTFSVSRTDLNGTPRPGKGTWRLVDLKQPEKTVAPADLPLAAPKASEKGDAYTTPGDALRPRWDPRYAYAAVLLSWGDGAEKGRGELVHGEGGKVELALPALPSGAYRLIYETVDDFGAPYKTTREFVVGGSRARLAIPCLFLSERSSVKVGEKARFLALSGLADQPLVFEIWRNGELKERRTLTAGKDATLIEIPVTEADRGGFSVRLSAVRDYQFMEFQNSVYVPWDNKQLDLTFSTFRDRIRPGGRETWRITVKTPSGKNAEAGAAEILAYMYDKSLDVFAPHRPPEVTSIYPSGTGMSELRASLGQAWGQEIYDELVSLPGYPSLHGDRLKFYDNYGIGGPGFRRYLSKGMAAGRDSLMVREVPMADYSAAAPAEMADAELAMVAEPEMKAKGEDVPEKPAGGTPEAPVEMRSDFSETAFWQPHLLTGRDGAATIEFAVPDSVTAWNVWAHGVTRDLMSGSLHQETRSVKDLMVRPYLPRFLREGDRAELKVVVNNASDREMKGKLTFEILDTDTQESLLSNFGLKPADSVKPFTVAAGGGTNLTFPIVTPVKVGQVAFKVVATSGEFSDGELRPLPVLPGRMHLTQSRFVVLRNADRREMTFADLARADDPSLVNEQMVVTLDAQLFYSVLSALPYLVSYPYECTEQTLNRFVSTGILSSLYKDYPAVSRMAAEFGKRESPLETWDKMDPNRKMALEETPWLAESRGEREDSLGSINVLDPRIARANRDEALAKLSKAQTSIGAFPWFPGGPPSPYMTLYILYGLSKALEFGVDVPRDLIQEAWVYMHQHYLDEIVRDSMARDCCWELVTFLNYTLSNYPDESWTGGVFSADERQRMLDFSFKHWKEHSPMLKCQLALSLRRMNRDKDAALVFESMMDSARSTPDEGTFWAAEDRSWLWYNDTIETHAFALRTLMEVTPQDARKEGLVVWIFLNKKLNHWKSTRATAEVIYSLVHYLRKEGALGAREEATVKVCNRETRYVFEPAVYTGKKNQTVVPGEKIDPKTCSTVVVEKPTKGVMFASATWSFSTEKLPEADRGDFLSVSRTYFKRENTGKEFVLKPLKEGAALRPGDELEVHLSVRSKHPCEYVHLRDPRAAGLEPDTTVSRYKWDLGIGWYEEVRDSGTNFFFEWLPQGEYTFRYRLRANMSGTFKVSPATLQSMYAPEFNAYSAGNVLTINGER